ncbi:hypothetical protein KFE25_002271 [Diacronema lutheri]|uniref:Fe2OG dioxygenase domain-containing protein n=1 Tax=Diacronema lutheri TaxID=2081491 RepID=A0A8J5XBG5_DIALT|nr:hypothetical protein KFE25_002271 [Diacronema lutheri]
MAVLASTVLALASIQTRRLTLPEIGALATRGFCAVPSWISSADVERIRADVLAADSAGMLRTASVGNGATARADDSIRRTRMCGLLPGPPSRVGCVDTRLQLTAAIERLRIELAELASDGALAPMHALTPFATECAYLNYPQGGYYTRHLDVPAANEGWLRIGRAPADGTSVARWERRRTISLLLYLNAGWDMDAWGGQLRVFTRASEPCATPQAADGGRDTASEVARVRGERDPAARDGAGTGASADVWVDIAPEGGTLVLMRSELVEHEVLATRQPRQCVVAWFRTERRAGLSPSGPHPCTGESAKGVHRDAGQRT